MSLSGWMKGLIFCLLILIIGIFLTDFVIKNNALVELTILNLSKISLSVAALVIIVFVSGGIVGLLLSSLMMIKLAVSNASCKKNLNRHKKMIQALETHQI